MEKYYHVKEEYLNILNELPALPSMPDIGEPDVTLSSSETTPGSYTVPP